MPKQETVDKFFGAVNEAYDALLDSIKSANERGYRVSKRLIDETEKGQRDAIGLAAHVAGEPRNISGFYSAAVRSLTDAQGRVLDLTRQFMDELMDTQQESRDVLRRIIEANRTAGQAAIEAARDAVGRAGKVARPARGGNGRAAEAPKAQRKQKEPAESEA